MDRFNDWTYRKDPAISLATVSHVHLSLSLLSQPLYFSRLSHPFNYVWYHYYNFYWIVLHDRWCYNSKYHECRKAHVKYDSVNSSKISIHSSRNHATLENSTWKSYITSKSMEDHMCRKAHVKYNNVNSSKISIHSSRNHVALENSTWKSYKTSKSMENICSFLVK